MLSCILKDYQQQNNLFFEQLQNQEISLGSFKKFSEMNLFVDNCVELPLISLFNFENRGFIKVPSSIFAIDNIRYDLMYIENLRVLAENRRGIACTKQRSEVRGSKRKIHPQKGTGKARAGSSRAPHRRKGGRAFGVKPRDFRIEIPKRVRRLAFCSILSMRFKEKSIFVFEETDEFFQIASKTKDIYKSSIGNLLSHSTLLLNSCTINKPFFRASRLLKGLKVKAFADELPAIPNFLGSKYILLSVDVLNKLIKAFHCV